MSKVGQQTQQSDRVYLRDLQLWRPYPVRSPTANPRPAASAAAEFTWDIRTDRHRWGVSKVGSKNTTIRQHSPCHGRSQHAREAVSRVYHDRLTSGLRLPLLLCWQELVGREGHVQGVSEAPLQKHSNNKELTVLAWLRQPYLYERPCHGRQPRLLLY